MPMIKDRPKKKVEHDKLWRQKLEMAAQEVGNLHLKQPNAERKDIVVDVLHKKFQFTRCYCFVCTLLIFVCMLILETCIYGICDTFLNTRMPFHVFLMFFIPLVCLLLKLQTSSDHDFSISFFLEEESDIITESGSQKYFADFHALLTKPSCREVSASRRGDKKVSNSLSARHWGCTHPDV